MSGNPAAFQLAPAIRRVLGGLRRRIRWYIWLEGTAWAIAWLGVAFWASLAVDRVFEPPAAARKVLLAAVGLVLAWVLVRQIVRRVFVPLRDSSLALLLERCFPQFGDSLLTAVELAPGALGHQGINRELLTRTCLKAAAPLGEVRLKKVFNPWPLRTSLSAAVLLGISVGVFGLARPADLGVWARRNLLFSDELWPRNTRLLMEGFQQGFVKVARGSTLNIVALADMNMPTVPDKLYVRYAEAGRRKSRPMSRLGQARPGVDPFQRFSYTFENILNPIRFDVLGGDDALRDLRIVVVDSPTLTMQIDCEYPAYTGYAPKTFPVAGMMQFPWGSRLLVRATSNKDLVRIKVDFPQEGPARRKPAGQPTVAYLHPLADNPRAFQYALGPLTEQSTLLLTLFDIDGIKSREPIRLSLSVLEDKPPELSARLQGIGSAGPFITPRAMLPVQGRVADDYGIARVWFEHAVDRQMASTVAIAGLKGHVTEYPLDAVLDAGMLGLRPGQKFSVSVKAEDRFDLAGGPNVGSTPLWQFEVLTPEQLQTKLKARQLVLRQRFEAVIRDMEDARNLLARIDFEPRPPGARPEGPSGGPAANAGDRQPASAEPATLPEETLAQRASEVQWVAQSSLKDAHEVLGLSAAFSEIRQELINNRIDDEESKRRLLEEIANPLRRIGEEMFPELDRALDQLLATVGQPAGEADRDRAAQQAQNIVAAMQQVLSKMTKLEDLNELVETLRSIIQLQQEVHQRTKQREREMLRQPKEPAP